MYMKRLILLGMVLCSVFLSYAQGEMDALRYSYNDITGTARAMGMGNAFGALGGDITGIAINPGGIGVYKSSEVVGTMNFENVSEKTSSGVSITENKFKFNFDNLGYVGYFPTGNDMFQSFNFGFTYNRLKNYDRTYRSQGYGVNSSLSDYIAIKSSEGSGIPEGYLMIPDPYREEDDPFFYENWLSVLGYNAYIINPEIIDPGTPDERTQYLPAVSLPVDNTLNVSEKGSISSYDFTFGTNISNFLSVGLTFSITDLHYEMSSYYQEKFDGNDNFYLKNWMETDGTGYNLKVGAIIRPIDALRIGIAYHSPTWYDMTDYYYADMYDVSGQGASSPEMRYDYNFHTPYKWVFSLAGVIGTRAIVSVDYEITDYKAMSFSGIDGEYMPEFTTQNDYIDQDFRRSSTVRAGLEYRITPQFSVRLGGGWMQTPLTTEFKDGDVEVATVGSIPNFILNGDTYYGSFGLGYKFTKNFYVDFAAVFKQQKSDLYAFSNIFESDYNHNAYLVSTPTKLTNNTFKGLLTFGYKF